MELHKCAGTPEHTAVVTVVETNETNPAQSLVVVFQHSVS